MAITDVYIANEGAPDNPDGSVWTSFFRDTRALTPDMFAAATSKSCTVELLPADTNAGLPERYHIQFAQPLTVDERELVIRIAQNNANYQALVAAATTAYTDNLNWANQDYASLISGANQIINTVGSSTQEKNLASGVKILADQVRDLCNQNRALMKLALGLNENPLG